MCRRRRMFAMMHLRNFCQASIEEVRQVMTRSPVRVPLSTETVKGVSGRLETLELRTPVNNFWLRHCSVDISQVNVVTRSQAEATKQSVPSSKDALSSKESHALPIWSDR